MNDIGDIRQEVVLIEGDLDCQDLRVIEAWSDWNMTDNATVNEIFDS